MSRVPISVCMIAKNEERYIEECLKRLQPYGVEIVVADTGSTDRTKEIAKQYADKVVDFTWIDDFSAARNFCAEQATNSWILALDCDEYINGWDIQGTKNVMNRFSKGIGAIRLNNLVITETGEKQYSTEQVIRFYHRSFYKFQAPIHEQLVAKSADIERQRTGFMLPMEVIHHGYAISKEEMRAKQERNLEILKKSIGQGGDAPYYYFQIGQSEFILQHTQAAIEAYEKALSLNPPTDRTYVDLMICALGIAYMKVGRIADAVAVMDQYAEYCKSARYVYTHAGVLYGSGQKLKSLFLYVTASTLPDFVSLGESKLHCYENIIEMYREFGEEDMATIFKEKYELCKQERDRIINS